MRVLLDGLVRRQPLPWTAMDPAPDSRLRRLRRSAKRITACTRSSSVESSSVSTPAWTKAWRSSASRCAAIRAKAFAKTRVMGVDQQLLAGLRVADGHQAEIGQVQLHRVEQAYRDHVMSLRELAQRLFPAWRADEVRHHEHRRAAPHGTQCRMQQLVAAGFRPSRRLAGTALHVVQQSQHLHSAAARRHAPCRRRPHTTAHRPGCRGVSACAPARRRTRPTHGACAARWSRSRPMGSGRAGTRPPSRGLR
jgi:hypothetical protein